MKTTNPILVRLNINEDQYFDMRMSMYMRYCMDFCINYHNDLQKLLANTALSKYYFTELAKCEEEFLQIMDAYEGEANVKPADGMEMYHKCAFRMHSIYSKPLIEQAKALNIICHNERINPN